FTYLGFFAGIITDIHLAFLTPLQQKTFITYNLIFKFVDLGRCEKPVQNDTFAHGIILVQIYCTDKRLKQITGNIFAEGAGMTVYKEFCKPEVFSQSIEILPVYNF